jgi:hypothetical protein
MALRRTKDRKASERVVEIYARWQLATKYLGPFMEFVPLILVSSIVVFIVGLVDSLFALSSGLGGLPSLSMYIASGVCCIVFIVVLSVVGGTVRHSQLHGASSPFQYFLSRFQETQIPDPRLLSAEETYREILIKTYDDTNLIDACGALDNLKETLRYGVITSAPETKMRLIDVLEFLLSPQSNKRCLLTAVSFIGQYYSLMSWRCI